MSKPPEDLRAKIAGYIDDYATYLQDSSDLNRSVLMEHTDAVLRLCAAAALAALPEPLDNPKSRNGTYMLMPEYVKGRNLTIATVQANIHSVFGSGDGLQ